MSDQQAKNGIRLQGDLEATYITLIDSALARAKAGGATQAAIGVHRDVGVSVTARLRDVETIEYQDDRGLGVTVYRGHCKGTASTSDFSDDAIAATIDKALYIATQTGADTAAGLADATRMATEFPDLQLDHPWPQDVDALRDMALASEAAALDADPVVTNSEGASVSSHRSISLYGNSHGFVATQFRSSHSIACSVIGGSGDNMQRDYEFTTARDPAALLQPEEVGIRAAKAVAARMSPRKLDTQTAPVVFRADVARTIFSHLMSAISGSAQYRKSSFLLDAVGQKIFAGNVNIEESPFLPAAAASTSYDNEGVATRERSIVDSGVLNGLLLSSYSARKLGLETTGNAGGVHNAVVTPTAGGLSEILATMSDGFLVTELMGQGVNLVTGDYSRGAAGFWVENGAIAYPVSEVTIAGNLKDMFQSLSAIGDDVDSRGVIRTGSLLIDGMTIAGN
ncbi:MAG: metalloprotease PmbA [Pseudomonadota bacterium]